MTGSPAVGEAVALARGGRGAEGAARLEAAAGGGDPRALLALALWRIDGRLIARDLVAARAGLVRAAALGDCDAARVAAALLANGTGGPADWPGALAMLRAWSDRDPDAARQLALIDAMAVTDSGDPSDVPLPQVLHEVPLVARFPALFSGDECAFLLEAAAARFKPALIFHEGQRRFVADPLRDGETASFPFISEGPAVHALNRRIAAASGTDVRRGETLQVLRYAGGQQYRPHLDAIPGLANQRVLTVLVYLNDDYDGGETDFPTLDVTVKGRTGDALMFANADANGRPDARTRHAGRPVTRGTKLAASRWIRARPPDDAASGFGQHEAGRS